MSTGQTKRDRNNFPRMKVRGRRWTRRLTPAERLVEAAKRITKASLRMGHLADAFVGVGHAAERLTAQWVYPAFPAPILPRPDAAVLLKGPRV